MSFILMPQRGERIQINAWNWRPTLELLRFENLVENEEALEFMGCNGCGAVVDEALAHRIAAAIDRIVKGMHPSERIRADLSLTSEPKSQFVFGAGEAPEARELYSARRECLVTFKSFCETSGGFKVL